jgi:hypothetical protein
MRKSISVLLGLLLGVMVSLLVAGRAYADSVIVSATLSGHTIQFQVTVSIAAYDPSAGTKALSVTLEPVLPFEYNVQGGCGNQVASYPLPASGGSFSFSGHVVAPQSGLRYDVCANIIPPSGPAPYYTEGDSLLNLLTVPPRACAPGTPQRLTLSTIARVANGREDVSNITDPAWRNEFGKFPSLILNATFTETMVGTKRAVYTYKLRQGQLKNLGNRLSVVTPTSQQITHVPPPDKTVILALSYTATQDDGTYCNETESVRTKTVPGFVPTVSVQNNVDLSTESHPTAGVQFSAPGGCTHTRVVPAQITITGKGADFTATTRDECSGQWSQHGRANGVTTNTWTTWNGDIFGFNHHGATATYTLTVSVNKRIVAHGSLNLSHNKATYRA